MVTNRPTTPDNGDKRQSKKAGLPPGTLVHIGKKKKSKVRMQWMQFDEESFEEAECDLPEACFKVRDTDKTAWINMDGIHKVEWVQQLGEHFGMHPLTLEDVLNTQHRPKSEIYENGVFVTLKMLGISAKGHRIISEQVSLALGDNWLISFQEKHGDLFDPIRDRIRIKQSTIRSKKADFLLYRLIDIVVDNYFLVIEHINDQIEHLEDQVNEEPNQSCLQDLQNMRKQII